MLLYRFELFVAVITYDVKFGPVAIETKVVVFNGKTYVTVALIAFFSRTLNH
jgi:hypothetical protein